MTQESQKPPAGPELGAVTGSPPAVVPSDRRFTTKDSCPYCGGEIACTAHAWEQDDDGSWYATDLDIECSNEPPIDSRKWDVWDYNHGHHDWNTAWHNLHESLVRGLKERFRFEMENAAAQPTLTTTSTHE